MSRKQKSTINGRTYFDSFGWGTDNPNRNVIYQYSYDRNAMYQKIDGKAECSLPVTDEQYAYIRQIGYQDYIDIGRAWASLGGSF